MSPPRPPWLDRWLQTDDDELLYVDQTMLVEGGLTIEEQQRVAAAQERLADARAAYHQAQEEEYL